MEKKSICNFFNSIRYFLGYPLYCAKNVASGEKLFCSKFSALQNKPIIFFNAFRTLEL